MPNTPENTVNTIDSTWNTKMAGASQPLPDSIENTWYTKPKAPQQSTESYLPDENLAQQFMDTIKPWVVLSQSEKDYIFQQSGRVAANGGDVSAWVNDFLTTNAVANALNVSREDVYKNKEKLAQYYLGIDDPKWDFTTGYSIINSYNQGKRQQELAVLQEDLLDLYKKGYGDDDERVIYQIDKIRKKQKESSLYTDDTPHAWHIDWTNSSVSQLAYMMEGTAAGLVGSLVGGAAGFAIGGPVAAKKGSEIGGDIARFITYQKQFEAQAFWNMKQAGVSTETALEFSAYDGLVNALNESLLDVGYSEVMGIAGGAFGIKNLGGNFIPNIVDAVAKNGLLPSTMAKFLVFQGLDATGEFVQESTQSLTSYMFQKWAEDQDNITHTTDFDNAWRDAMNEGVQGFLTGLFFGGITGGVDAFKDFTISTSLKNTAIRTPSKEAFVNNKENRDAVQALRLGGNLLSEEQVSQTLSSLYDATTKARTEVKAIQMKMLADAMESGDQTTMDFYRNKARVIEGEVYDKDGNVISGKGTEVKEMEGGGLFYIEDQPTKNAEGKSMHVMRLGNRDVVGVDSIQGKVADAMLASSDGDGNADNYMSGMATDFVRSGATMAMEQAGKITFEIDDNANRLTITGVEVQGDDQSLKSKAIRQLASMYAEYDIEWSNRSDNDNAVFAEIESANPRNTPTRTYGLNYVARTFDTKDRAEVKRWIGTNFSQDEAENSMLAMIVQAAASARGMTGMDFINRYFGEIQSTEDYTYESEARESLAKKGVENPTKEQLEAEQKLHRLNTKGFTKTTEIDGQIKAVIYAGKYADPTTFMHELDHAIVLMGDNMEVFSAIMQKVKGTEQFKDFVRANLDILHFIVGKTDEKGNFVRDSKGQYTLDEDKLAKLYTSDKWTRDDFEFESRLAEATRRSGQTLNPELKGFFRRVAEVFRKVYTALRNGFGNVKLNDEVLDFFDKLYGYDRHAPEGQQFNGSLSYGAEIRRIGTLMQAKKSDAEKTENLHRKGNFENESELKDWVRNTNLVEYDGVLIVPGIKKTKSLPRIKEIGFAKMADLIFGNRTVLLQENLKIKTMMERLGKFKSPDSVNSIIGDRICEFKRTMSSEGSANTNSIADNIEDGLLKSEDVFVFSFDSLVDIDEEKLWKQVSKNLWGKSILDGNHNVFILSQDLKYAKMFSVKKETANTAVSYDGRQWVDNISTLSGQLNDIISKYFVNGEQENKYISLDDYSNSSSLSQKSDVESMSSEDQYNYIKNKYEGTEQYMMAPNGKATNLTERQWVQVRTPNFKKWFGDWENDPQNASKIVDENGEPLVMYHGTGNYGFDVFRTYELDNNFGSHFGSISAATGFMEGGYGSGGDNPGVYAVFLNVRNPWDLYDLFAQDNNYPAAEAYNLLKDEVGTKEAIELAKSLLDRYPWLENDIDNLSSDIDDRWDYAEDKELYSVFRKAMELAGYDGIKYQNDLEDVIVDEKGNSVYDYVVQNPNQIKSATENNGDFSSDYDSILKQDSVESGDVQTVFNPEELSSMTEKGFTLSGYEGFFGRTVEGDTVSEADIESASKKFVDDILMQEPEAKERPLRILVACEESQAVAKAFRAQGHEAYSFDIQDQTGGHPEWHVMGDVTPFINGNCTFTTTDGVEHNIDSKWDMIIAFPPCTYMTNAGACRMYPQKGVIDPVRYQKSQDAKAFFMLFANADCDRIAIENPRPMRIVGLPKESQRIQPWMFGHPYTKLTYLWLKGLENLVPTNVITENIIPYVNGGSHYGDKTRQRMGTAHTAKMRSKTFTGVAEAMVNQWTKEDALLQTGDDQVPYGLYVNNSSSEHFADQLLDQNEATRKSVETRTRRAYQSLVRAGIKPGDRIAIVYDGMVQGYVTFEGVVDYKDEEDFYKDAERHHVYRDSKYKYDEKKGKVGLILTNPERVTPYAIDGRNDYTIAKVNRSDDSILHQKVEDSAIIYEFNNAKEDEYILANRSMQLIDGKLYPPMAAVIRGQRQDGLVPGDVFKAEENPDLAKPDLYTKDDKKGHKKGEQKIDAKTGRPVYKFDLKKGGYETYPDGSLVLYKDEKTGRMKPKKLMDVPANYDPYIHATKSFLNDQFESAYKRPNLVTVQVKILKRDLESGYWAEKASLPVGEHAWKSGSVSSALKKYGINRNLLLSQYCQIVRVIPDSEVADNVAELIKDTDVSIPDNTVTPSLLAELKKRDVSIKNTEEVRLLNEWYSRHKADNSILEQYAYHGSGVSFDKFLTEYINSGEGSQTFGWGLYFTDSDRIAKDYAGRQGYSEADRKQDLEYYTNQKQKTLAELEELYPLWEKLQDKSSAEYEAVREEVRKSLSKRTELANKYPKSPLYRSYLNMSESDVNSYIDKYADVKAYETKSRIDSDEYYLSQYDMEILKLTYMQAPKGRHLYKVELPDNGWLDYESKADKNLARKVIDALLDEGEYPKEIDDVFYGTKFTGETLYNAVMEFKGTPRATSEFLNSLGVVGIRYDAGKNFSLPEWVENAKNYVVFNQDDVTLVNHWDYQTDEDAEALYQVTVSEDEVNEAMSFLDTYSVSEKARISKNLELHKGTPWYVRAVVSLLVRKHMTDVINHRAIPDTSMLYKTSKKVIPALENGVDGIFSYIRQTKLGFIGEPEKPKFAVNSSLLNCNPSEECAKFCYATGNDYRYATSIVKSELVNMAIDSDPVRAAKETAYVYRKAADGMLDKALRIFDKGDMSDSYVKYIQELNRLGIYTQVFSKRPEFLSKLDMKMNVVMLSIDKSNLELAANYPDLPLAVVYTGEQDIPFIEENKERFEKYGGVILPVKMGSKYMEQSVIDKLPKWAQNHFVCPIDGGKQELGDWTCRECDHSGTAGCFFHRSVKDRQQVPTALDRLTEGDRNEQFDIFEAELRNAFAGGDSEKLGYILGRLALLRSGKLEDSDTRPEGKADAEPKGNGYSTDTKLDQVGDADWVNEVTDLIKKHGNDIDRILDEYINGIGANDNAEEQGQAGMLINDLYMKHTSEDYPEDYPDVLGRQQTAEDYPEEDFVVSEEVVTNTQDFGEVPSWFMADEEDAKEISAIQYVINDGERNPKHDLDNPSKTAESDAQRAADFASILTNSKDQTRRFIRSLYAVDQWFRKNNDVAELPLDPTMVEDEETASKLEAMRTAYDDIDLVSPFIRNVVMGGKELSDKSWHIIAGQVSANPELYMDLYSRASGNLSWAGTTNLETRVKQELGITEKEYGKLSFSQRRQLAMDIQDLDIRNRILSGGNVTTEELKSYVKRTEEKAAASLAEQKAIAEANKYSIDEKTKQIVKLTTKGQNLEESLAKTVEEKNKVQEKLEKSVTSMERKLRNRSISTTDTLVHEELKKALAALERREAQLRNEIARERKADAYFTQASYDEQNRIKGLIDDARRRVEDLQKKEAITPEEAIERLQDLYSVWKDEAVANAVEKAKAHAQDILKNTREAKDKSKAEALRKQSTHYKDRLKKATQDKHEALKKARDRYTQAMKERQAALRIRKEKERMAKQIMKKPSANVALEEANKIVAIQMTVDPKFRAKSITIDGTKYSVGDLKGILASNPSDPIFMLLSQAQIERLSKKSLDEMTLGEVEQIYNLVKALRSEGLQKRMAEVMRVKAENKAIQTALLNEVYNSPDYKEPEFSGSQEEKDNQRSIREKYISKKLATFNMARKAQMLDGGRKGMFYDLLLRKKRMLQSIEREAQAKRIDAVMAVVESSGINVDDLYQVHDVVFDGDKTRRYTVADLIYVYLSKNNRQNRDAVAYGKLVKQVERDAIINAANQSIIGNGTEADKARKDKVNEDIRILGDARYDAIFSVAKEVVEGTPGLLEVVKAIESDFNSDGFQKTVDLMARVYNMEVVRESYYLPINRTGFVGVEPADRLKNDLLNQIPGTKGTVEKGYTIKRQTISPMFQKEVDIDIFHVWQQSVRDQEHTLAFLEYVRQLNSIFIGNSMQTDTLRQVISSTYGKAMLDAIDNHIKEIADPDAGQLTKSPADGLLRLAKGNVYSAYLGFKLSSITNQLITSPAAFLGKVSPLRLGSKMLEMAVSWKSVRDKCFALSTFMRNRSYDIIAGEIRDAASEAGANKYIKGYNKVLDIGLSGLEYVDQYCVVAGWTAIYEQEIERLGGMETEENVAEAVRIADEYVIETQPQSDKTEIAPMFKDKNEALNIILQFQSSLNVVWQNWIYDIPTAFKNGDFRTALGTTFGYIAAGALLGLAHKEITGKDDDDDEFSWIRFIRQFLYSSTTQFVEGVPVFSNMVDNWVKQIITGEKPGYSSGTDLFPAIGKDFKAVGKMTEWAYERDAETFQKAMEYTAQAVSIHLGLPYSAVNDVKRIKDNGWQAMIGAR